MPNDILTSNLSTLFNIPLETDIATQDELSAVRKELSDSIDEIKGDLGSYLPLSGGTLSEGFCIKAMTRKEGGEEKDFIRYIETFDSEIEEYGDETIAIGSEITQVPARDYNLPGGNIAIGDHLSLSGTARSILIGSYSSIDNDMQNDPNVLIGISSKARSGGSIAIGPFTEALSDCAIALGDQAKAKAENATQIGVGTNNKRNTLQFLNYTVIDQNGNVPLDRISTYDFTNNTTLSAVSATVLTQSKAYADNKFISRKKIKDEISACLSTLVDYDLSNPGEYNILSIAYNLNVVMNTLSNIMLMAKNPNN